MKPNLFTYWCQMLCIVLVSCALAFSAQASEIPDAIGVRVFDNYNSSTLSVTAASGSMWVDAGNKTLQVNKGQTVKLVAKGSVIEAFVGSDRIAGSQITLRSEAGIPLGLNTAAEIRHYAGTLEVSNRRGSLQVVNRVPLEEYIASVVGSEYGFKDLEGSKAMAVVARTYVLHALQNGKELLDNETFQVYRGLSHATPIARQAAFETAGQVLKYNGELIEAVYSASNGGKTAYNTSVWGTNALPYLISKNDPWDKKSPHAEWDWSIDKDQLLSTLSDSFGMKVKDIRTGKPSSDGRITEVELKGSGSSKTITGSSFRAAVARRFGAKSLRSTYFNMNERRGSYSFSGQGFGHGVGLSQWGTHFMADEGRSYTQILDFYYAKTRLESLPSLGGSDQSLLELPVLAGSSSVSATASSASLQDVSGESATPKENNSTIFESTLSTRSASETVHNIWDTPNKTDAESPQKENKKPAKSTRRAGW